MPEGPSIIILKEACQPFIGKKVIGAEGSTEKIILHQFLGKKIIDFKSWGKHFLICFPGDITIRIHLLLFGSYLINEQKEAVPRLSLRFRNGEINFYACAIRQIDKPLDEEYDWTADVMNPGWDSKQALSKLNAHKNILVCDALFDQTTFAGVGKIIKNEVLFRTKVHPKSRLEKIPLAKRKEIIKEAVHYSFQFLEWKKAFTLKQHWLAHNKKTCPRDHILFQMEYLGKTNRRSFFCNQCQKLYE